MNARDGWLLVAIVAALSACILLTVAVLTKRIERLEALHAAELEVVAP